MATYPVHKALAQSFDSMDIVGHLSHKDMMNRLFKNWFSYFPESFIAGSFTAYLVGCANTFSDVNIFVPCKSTEAADEKMVDILSFFHAHVTTYQYNLRAPGFRNMERRVMEAFVDFDDPLCLYGSSSSSTCDQRGQHKMEISVCVVPSTLSADFQQYRHWSMLEIVRRFNMASSRWVLDSLDLDNDVCTVVPLCHGGATQTRATLRHIVIRRKVIMARYRQVRRNMTRKKKKGRVSKTICKNMWENTMMSVRRLWFQEKCLKAYQKQYGRTVKPVPFSLRAMSIARVVSRHDRIPQFFNYNGHYNSESYEYFAYEKELFH